MAAVEDTHPLQKQLDEAVALADSDKDAAEASLRDRVLGSDDNSPEALKIREQAVYRLGELFAKTAQAAKLEALLRECRPFFGLLPKARTAKTGECKAGANSITYAAFCIEFKMSQNSARGVWSSCWLRTDPIAASLKQAQLCAVRTLVDLVGKIPGTLDL